MKGPGTGTPLLDALKAEAVRRSLWPADDTAVIGLEESYLLVRDMDYKRASSRQPLTTIREWRGTCSGKHYLLKALFAEFGYSARLMACTQHIPAHLLTGAFPAVHDLLADGPIPDVHNYLVLETPQGDMRVDATFPVSFAAIGLPVNEDFTWGRDMALACVPLEHFDIPGDTDPQQFKEELLRMHFTATELARRDAFFELLGVA